MKNMPAICIALVIGLTQAQQCLGNNDEMLTRLQKDSHISVLIAKRYIEERAALHKRNPDPKKISLEDKILKASQYESALCAIHDMEISVKQEECDGQESIMLETKVFGTVDDFEDAEVLEAEKRLLKFVLIKACAAALKNYTAKNKKAPVALVLDYRTKVTIQPTFVVIKRGLITLPGEEKVSKERKGMQLLTIFSKAEFDVLAKKYFNA
jgi:hypothetical protein